jgi:hypothetical protein
MRRRLPSLCLLLFWLLPAGCLNKKIVNPNIVLPGSPGNRPSDAADAAEIPVVGGSELLFLGTNTVPIPAGTPLTVRLDTALDTGSNRTGDSFRGVLSEPIQAAGGIAVSAGAPVLGQITDAAPGSGSAPATLSLNLLEVMVNNRWVAVQTNLLVITAGSSSEPEAVPAVQSDAPGGGFPIRVLRVPGSSVHLAPGETLAFELAQAAMLETAVVAGPPPEDAPKDAGSPSREGTGQAP